MEKFPKTVLAFMCVLMLCACGGAPSTPTVPPAATATTAQSAQVQSLPALMLPGMGAGEDEEREILSRMENELVASGDESGVPDWVAPGSRVVYYNAVAAVPSNSFVYIEDPNGNWVDNKTGKRYRRSDETGESIGGTSSDGFNQIDIVAVEDNQVVLSWTQYGIDRTGLSERFTPVAGGGAKVAGAQIDGLWIHPATLESLKEAEIANTMVLVGEYPLNDVTYDAISFVSVNTPSYQSYTYDLDTGLLLASTISTSSAGSGVPGQGSTYVSIVRLAEVRQRPLPGPDDANPDWVAEDVTLNYEGTYTIVNQYDPSMIVSFPTTQAIKFGDTGNTWAYFTGQTQIQAPGAQPINSSGMSGTAGLYWIDTNALKGMKKGQVLDEDPITGEVVKVKSIDNRSGGKVVTITSELKGLKFEVAYDQATGVLINYKAEIASNGTTIELKLKEKP